MFWLRPEKWFIFRAIESPEPVCKSLAVNLRINLELANYFGAGA
jgi:hypothetical protein